MKNVVLFISLVSFLNVFTHEEEQLQDYSKMTDLILNKMFIDHYSDDKGLKFRSQAETLDGKELIRVSYEIPEVIPCLKELEPKNYKNIDKLNLEKEIISQLVLRYARSKPFEHNAEYELDSGTTCLLEIHSNKFSCQCSTIIPKEYYEKKVQEFRIQSTAAQKERARN